MYWQSEYPSEPVLVRHADSRKGYFVDLSEHNFLERSLLKHVEMHRLGDFYDIPLLRQYACEQISEELQCITWTSENLDEFVIFVEAVYGSNLMRFCSLRKIVAEAFANHPYVRAENEDKLWASLIKELPQLPRDALHVSYSNRPAPSKCCWHAQGRGCF